MTTQAEETAHEADLKTLHSAQQVEKDALVKLLAELTNVQLNASDAHREQWSIVIVHRLEHHIDNLRKACLAYRVAKDGVILATANATMGVRLTGPSPADLLDQAEHPPDGTLSAEEILKYKELRASFIHD